MEARSRRIPKPTPGSVDNRGDAFGRAHRHYGVKAFLLFLLCLKKVRLGLDKKGQVWLSRLCFSPVSVCVPVLPKMNAPRFIWPPFAPNRMKQERIDASDRGPFASLVPKRVLPDCGSSIEGGI